MSLHWLHIRGFKIGAYNNLKIAAYVTKLVLHLAEYHPISPIRSSFQLNHYFNQCKLLLMIYTLGYTTTIG